jgi:uncharacterized cupin superfamily protein
MKKILSQDRLVANIATTQFTKWKNSDGSDSNTEILQLGGSKKLGTGFHIYRMAPRSSSEAHEHQGDEEFFVIEGSLRDNDGTIYVKGDLILLKDGTQHFSVSDEGCLLAVYIPREETNL